MPDYVAFLRAVNVGGTGKLPMADLRQIAQQIGGGNPQTYIASGNLILTHSGTASEIQTALESALHNYADKPVGVVIRTLPQIDALLNHLTDLPFASAAPNRVMVLLTDAPIPDAPAAQATHLTTEEIAPYPSTSKPDQPGALFIHYPDGQGRSRLSLPLMSSGTARNLNTLRKLQQMLVQRQSA